MMFASCHAQGKEHDSSFSWFPFTQQQAPLTVLPSTPLVLCCMTATNSLTNHPQWGGNLLHSRMTLSSLKVESGLTVRWARKVTLYHWRPHLSPLDVNECAARPCKNGGSCRDLEGDFVCQCPSPYVGKQCHLRKCVRVCLCACVPVHTHSWRMKAGLR